MLSAKPDWSKMTTEEIMKQLKADWKKQKPDNRKTPTTLVQGGGCSPK